jgi:hypothetical protein
MKVLIQNPDTLLYLASPDLWCPEMKTAFDFGNSDEAVAFCAKHHIAPAQVVLQWEGLPYSISIPVFAQHQMAAERTPKARKHE